jgi:hypothetical protein
MSALVERGGSRLGWARRAGGHWRLGLSRAAEMRCLSTRARLRIAGRWLPRQRLLPGKLRSEADRPQLAGGSSSRAETK